MRPDKGRAPAISLSRISSPGVLDAQQSQRSAFGIPDEHRVRQEAQAARLVHDFAHITCAELAVVGEEEATAREIITMLAMVELKLHHIPHLFVIEIAGNEDRFHDLPQGREGPRQAV